MWSELYSLNYTRITGVILIAGVILITEVE